MSNKLQNRVLLPNGQFASFPEKKLDDEVKYEQIKEEKAKEIKKSMKVEEENTVPRPKAKATKKKHNAKAIKSNNKQAEKQAAYDAKND